MDTWFDTLKNKDSILVYNYFLKVHFIEEKRFFIIILDNRLIERWILLVTQSDMYFGGKGVNDISIRDGKQNTDRIW